MLTPASVLLALSSGVTAYIAAVHLYYTFATDKFLPRDPDLKGRLEAVSPVLTRQTTMWKAWIGFNTSHALGLLLFAAVYGDLAIAHLSVLLGSPFLLLTGAALLIAFLVLSKVYWFKGALRGVALATLLYVSGVVVGLLSQ